MRINILSISLLISILLVGTVPLSAREEGKTPVTYRVGEVRAEKPHLRSSSKLQTAASDSEEIEVRKEDAGSSKEKTFCFSIGGGLPLYDRGSELLADLNHLPITLRMLKYPVAVMISLDYSSSAESTIYNILYIRELSDSRRVSVFLGGGIGSYEILEDKQHEKYSPGQKHTLYNLEAGCKARMGFLGSFAKVKHLNAKGAENSVLLVLGLDVNISI